MSHPKADPVCYTRGQTLCVTHEGRPCVLHQHQPFICSLSSLSSEVLAKASANLTSEVMSLGLTRQGLQPSMLLQGKLQPSTQAGAQCYPRR